MTPTAAESISSPTPDASDEPDELSSADDHTADSDTGEDESGPDKPNSAGRKSGAETTSGKGRSGGRAKGGGGSGGSRPPGALVRAARVFAFPPGPGRGVLVSVLILLIAVLVVVSGWYGWQVSSAADLASRRQQILTDSRDAAQNLLSFRSDTIDADQRRVLSRATGDFRDEYSRGAAQLKAGIVQAKASATASILDAGVTTADEDSATVLVVADVTSKSAQVPKGVVRHVRIQQQMSYENGRWLMAKLQFVG